MISTGAQIRFLAALAVSACLVACDGDGNSGGSGGLPGIQEPPPLTAAPPQTPANAPTGLTLISDTQPVADNPRIRLLRFDSTVLGGGGPNNPDVVNAVVLLPANYNPSRAEPYPVIYHYHGGLGSASTSLAGTFATQLAVVGLDAIVVLPDGGPVGFYQNWFNNGAGGTPEWETFHIRQLLPFIDQNYNTVKARWGRATTGYSMGGGGMRYAAKYPDLIGITSAFSAAIDLTQPDIDIRADPRAAPLVGQIFGQYEEHEVQWRGTSVPDVAKNLANTNLTITHGDAGAPEGTYIQRGSLATKARLEQLSIPLNYRFFPGNNHGQGQVPSLQYWLPIVKAYFEDPRNRSIPTAFSYSSIGGAYQAYGWNVTVQRSAVEFSALEVTNIARFSVIGSGQATVQTPPVRPTDFRVLATITNLSNPQLSTSLLVTPDANGRLTIPVNLGPANLHQQFSAQADAASTGPSPDAASVPFTVRGNASRFYRVDVALETTRRTM